MSHTPRERSFHELYADDPERADALVFGRRTDATRRGFLGGAGLAAVSAAVGGPVVYAASMPAGLIPAAMAQTAPAAPAAPAAAPQGPQPLDFPGKDRGLVLLQDRPLVAETPEHLLDDDTTSISRFFIRNNGQMPPAFTENPDTWRLKIDGEVNTPLDLSLGDLKARFRPVTLRMQMECGGNGRSSFQPAARGNQWGNGAIGCAEWTGVRLADVLAAAGVKPSAVYTANFGADPHLSGDAARQSISRGVPMAKALEPHSLLVFAMNGEPLPVIHGGPMRVLHPGWPGSASHKWVNRIWIRDKEHDGPGMTGTQYRMPRTPIVPGGRFDEKDFAVMESMPVRGILTNPRNGTRLAAGTREFALRGTAWAGDEAISRVDISLDFGATWQQTTLAAARNRYDWQRFTHTLRLPSDGYFEIWTRATDTKGRAQPHIAGNWNPQGYGANPMHRVAVLVGGQAS